MILKDLMGLSEYAKYRKSRGFPGGTTQSVLNALADGRIPFVVVGKNKMVNPVAADRAWLLNTDTSRYGVDQLAAIHSEPPAPTVASPGPSITPESVQSEAWEMCFKNTAIAAAVLVRHLGLEPAKALRAAMEAVSILCYTLAEATDNAVYLNGSIPPWASPLVDGDFENEAVKQQLDNVSWLAAELYRPEEEPPPPDDDLDADLAALGIV